MPDLAVVTGAFSYTGSAIAHGLRARGLGLRTLTNRRVPLSPAAADDAAEIEVRPLQFGDPPRLEAALRGARVLVNTYWVCYPFVGVSFPRAVENTEILLQAARRAGVARVVCLYHRGCRRREDLLAPRPADSPAAALTRTSPRAGREVRRRNHGPGPRGRRCKPLRSPAPIPLPSPSVSDRARPTAPTLTSPDDADTFQKSKTRRLNCLTLPCKDEGATRARARYVIERYAQAALCEEFVEGRELNVTVLGEGESAHTLALMEIDYSGWPAGQPRLITYNAKWEEESEECKGSVPRPARDLSPELAEAIRASALGAYRALGLRDYGRVDIRVHPERGPLVLDVNSNPDLTPGAGISKAAKASGIAYEELIREIVLAARARSVTIP